MVSDKLAKSARIILEEIEKEDREYEDKKREENFKLYGFYRDSYKR